LLIVVQLPLFQSGHDAMKGAVVHHQMHEVQPHLTLSAVERGCTMKSPEPQFQERLFLVSWWKGVMLVAWLMGANMVKEAVPVLSTHKCLKKLPALLDCMG